VATVARSSSASTSGWARIGSGGGIHAGCDPPATTGAAASGGQTLSTAERDKKFTRNFDAIFAPKGTTIPKTLAPAPMATANRRTLRPPLRADT